MTTNAVVSTSEELRPEESISVPVTFAAGDGIGAEIMEATLGVLQAAGAKLQLKEIKMPEKANMSHRDIIELLDRLEGAGLDFIKAENLCNFDGVPGYALGQGQ